jgi:hypothetical protein
MEDKENIILEEKTQHIHPALTIVNIVQVEALMSKFSFF